MYNPDSVKSRFLKIKKNSGNSKFMRWYRKNLEKGRKHNRDCAARRTKEIREEIHTMLGKKCARCGFSDDRILQIDHIKGNGHFYRKRFHDRRSYLLSILKELKSGSKDYQLLCPNCNWLKRLENKEAPMREDI